MSRPAELTGAAAVVVARVARHGPLPLSTVLEIALYDPTLGFYDGGGGRAGTTGGDFITSAEVGPLFGRVLAGALDRWWDELGRPDPFVVIDAGAGPGTLATAVLAADGRCTPALTYVLVERAAHQRARHGRHLRLVDPTEALPAVQDDIVVEPGTGPRVVSLAELPAGRSTGVVIANELLDNLPFQLLERTASRWDEVRVGVDDLERPAELVEVRVPAGEALDALARRLAPEAPEGGRLAVQTAAASWLHDALGCLDAGRVLALDYATTSPDMAARPWHEWVRTYRRHEPGGHPLDHLGEQDVTCEVAVDQLARVRRPDVDRSQAELLAAHGIDALVDEGRRTWEERAHIGDLAAVAARSRIAEAEALTDPSGLGRFRALEWIVPGPAT